MIKSDNKYFWAFIERVAPLAISFIISVIIARIVGPEAYGLVAMLAIFMALGQAFTELGFGAAIVQKKEITPDDETSVFVINLVAGLVITIILCAISPLVARFFDREALVQLLCYQSLGIFIASTALVQFAQMSRQMKFRLGALIEVLATTVSGAVGIGMAFSGYEVWSLIGLGLTRESVRAASAWIIIGWRPRGRFSWGCVGSMWDYCSKLLYSSLLHRIVTNIHSVLVGKIFAPEALGLYARASGLQALPIGVVVGIVQRVAFPTFSKHQDDKIFLLRSIRKQTRLLAMIVSLMMGILASVSENLIPWLLGPGWVGAVPLLKIICMAGFFSAVFPLHSQMTMALGESSLFLKIELLKKIFIVIVLLIVSQFSLEAFAWGTVAISFADYCYSTFPSTKLIGYTWKMQFVDLVPFILLGIVPTVALLNIPWSSSLSNLLLILIKIIIFISSSGFFIAALRKSSFQEEYAIFMRCWQATVSRMNCA